MATYIITGDEYHLRYLTNLEKLTESKLCPLTSHRTSQEPIYSITHGKQEVLWVDPLTPPSVPAAGTWRVSYQCIGLSPGPGGDPLPHGGRSKAALPNGNTPVRISASSLWAFRKVHYCVQLSSLCLCSLGLAFIAYMGLRWRFIK